MSEVKQSPGPIDSDERAVVLIICAAGDVGICPEFYGSQRLVAERLRQRGVIYRVKGDEEDPAGYAITSAYASWAELLHETAHETREEIRNSYYKPNPLS